MGEVYRAEDITLRQQVALKFLPEQLANDSRLRKLLQQEVRVARHVSHPNVCRVYDIGETDGDLFISMEYVDGEDLESLTRRIDHLPPLTAVRIARQLCAGLAAAHEKGVLHRDLKPRNVMIDGRGDVRIVDFGLAGFVRSFAHEKAGLGVGTLAYMAPEQLAGREVTQWSDIYSLGLILYHLFTGKPVFHAETADELLRIRAEGAFVLPSSLCKEIDPRVERLILRCLERDPRARPASAKKIASNLPGGDPLAETLAAGETPSPELVAAAGGVSRIKVSTGILCMVASLLLIGLAAFLADRNSLFARVPFPKPPAVLVDRAERVIAPFLSDVNAVDCVHAFVLEQEYFLHVDRSDRSTRRWDSLSSQHPPGVYFWYSRSVSHRIIERPSESQAKDGPLAPGDAIVHLDPRGQLLRFKLIPLRAERAGVSAQSYWPAAFGEAGLDLADFDAVQSVGSPPVSCDSRVAWKPRNPSALPRIERIEAGALGGMPVYFEIVRPWRTEQVVSQPRKTAYDVLVLGFTGAFLGASVLLAARNLRLQRSDRIGARRLASFSFVSLLVVWVFQTRHVLSPLDEWRLFVDGAGYALFWSIFLWLMYLSLEPFVRRRWPRRLISWSRLLAGRLRDPSVGKDLLVGVLLGAALLIVGQGGYEAALWLKVTPAPPYAGAPGTLLGATSAATTTGDFLVGCVWFAFAFLFLNFLLFAVLRREWLTKLVFFVLVTAVGTLASQAGSLGLAALITALEVGILMLALYRFGLLSLAGTLFTVSMLAQYPVTWRVASWQFGSGLFAMVTCAALAIFGLYCCVAGRPFFDPAYFERVERQHS